MDQSGTDVAKERVDFGYNLAGQTSSIVRYKGIDGGSDNQVATSAFTYHPNIGLLTDLTHTHGASTIDYTWTYDVINRVEQTRGKGTHEGRGHSTFHGRKARMSPWY